MSFSSFNLFRDALSARAVLAPSGDELRWAEFVMAWKAIGLAIEADWAPAESEERDSEPTHRELGLASSWRAA